MLQLIARGVLPQHRWRKRVPLERAVTLGRRGSGWEVPWDSQISRQHVKLQLDRGHLVVERLPDASNPVFFRGEPHDTAVVREGEHFVLGRTTFLLVNEEVAATLEAPRPWTEQGFPSQLLQTVQFENANDRIEALAKLPEVIRGSSDDEELFNRLTNLLFSAIPAASFVAFVALRDPDFDDAPVAVLHWDHAATTSTDVAPSEQLIRQAIRGQESRAHTWLEDKRHTSRSFTQSESIDWAFCTPVRGDSCHGWGIYVAGGGGESAAIQSAMELQDDVKFAEIVSTTLASLRDLRNLEQHRVTLGQFISPVVLDTIAGQDPDLVLEPKESQVSVLFCDLRGFSRKSEKSSDNLMELLHRISLALGVMTRQIRAHGGVIGDFHGDAAMGFWGWPLPQDDAALRAGQAALAIRQEFAAASQDEGHPLRDFSAGIGIASGTAVAGKIGTVDQVKITVFGPVVNLSSRLEGMTKLLHASILIDEETANSIAEHEYFEGRLRRVAKVQPYGLETPLMVNELLPSAEQFPALDDKAIQAYERALDLLLERDWEAAFAQLHNVPAVDRVKDFLTVFIAQHNRTPPKDWDGVIPMRSKF